MGQGGVISQRIHWEPVAVDCFLPTRQAVVTFSEAVRRKMSRLTSISCGPTRRTTWQSFWPAQSLALYMIIKSPIVDADSYLLQLVRYIHKNPVNAGRAEQSDQYHWSSHKGYISNAKKWDWLYSRFVLNMLTPHKNQQIRKYKQFMTEDISEEINQVFDKKYLPSMLGSEKFIQWVKNTFFRQKRHMEVPDSKALAPDSETIIETICRFYKIHRDKLFTVKRGTENEPRLVAIYLIRTIRAEPLLKIGALFNLKKHSSVSSAVERTKNRLEKDRTFRKRFDKINNMIYKGQSEI